MNFMTALEVSGEQVMLRDCGRKRFFATAKFWEGVLFT